MIAPKHDSEEYRLQELYRYQVLDTPDEASFDEITRLIAHICQTPIAVINLVDKDRQWFKSEIGLGVRETPLDISICAHAILQPGLFIIPDTQNDARFADNPLVTGDPGLRFYAGALLESTEGQPLGTLCVLDYKPRELTEAQKDALLILSRQVMAQMELRLQLRAVETLNKRLQRMMAESHHRIKNHLQALSALVDMQATQGKAMLPVTEFQRIGQHISALATIHDLLTQEARTDSEVTEIPARFALDKIVNMMQAVLDNRPVVRQIADVSLTVQQTTALAVLVNELLSNAVKHGKGAILLSLIVEEKQIVLEVCDDGPGFPADFNPKQAANTGLDLIESLACWDLRGQTYYLNRQTGGATVRVVFPVATENI